MADRPAQINHSLPGQKSHDGTSKWKIGGARSCRLGKRERIFPKFHMILLMILTAKKWDILGATRIKTEMFEKPLFMRV